MKSWTFLDRFYTDSYRALDWTQALPAWLLAMTCLIRRRSRPRTSHYCKKYSLSLLVFVKTSARIVYHSDAREDFQEERGSSQDYECELNNTPFGVKDLSSRNKSLKEFPTATGQRAPREMEALKARHKAAMTWLQS